MAAAITCGHGPWLWPWLSGVALVFDFGQGFGCEPWVFAFGNRWPFGFWLWPVAMAFGLGLGLWFRLRLWLVAVGQGPYCLAFQLLAPGL